MNSRQRVARAMRHELPDRVPVMCQLALGHFFLHSENWPADIWFDSGVLVETLIEFQRRYRFDGIDTLDPPPLGSVDLAEAKSEYGDRLFFKGNLDAVNEMLHADDRQFEEAVIDRLRTGKPGSGYILSSACSVAPHVKPQRIMQLAELAEKYGRYNEG
jgi:hypothetical protein